MTNETFTSVWDAIEDTPTEAENMKLRSALMIAIKDHIKRHGWTQALKTSVDIVDLRTASSDLVHRILRDGELIVETDPGARMAFEVQARNEYFDVLPHLQRYRRRLPA